MTERILRGIPAAPGTAVGRVAWLRGSPGTAPESAAVSTPAQEQARFQAALDAVRSELEDLVLRTRAHSGDEAAAVFEAHLLLLTDPELEARVGSTIAGGAKAQWAVAQARDELAQILSALEDPYLKERAADVRDVTGRVLAYLEGRAADPLADLEGPVVLLADDLLPSQTARLDPAIVLGLATSGGGPTSHTVILARSRGLPAVVALGEALHGVPDGALVALDGAGGTLTVGPGPETLERFRLEEGVARAKREELEGRSGRPNATADGHRIELAANIAGPADLPACRAAGAEGVGLFRTEFLYMDRDAPPSEEEQYQVYRQVLEGMAPFPVVIRTLDAGGDKPVPCLGIQAEANPFLGLRGIRFCLGRPDLFKPQLRALLRAAAHGRLRIMFPMVSSAPEVREARLLLEECRQDLQAAGIPTGPAEVGIMVEVPSAALCAEALAPEVDFFSIGSNDLTQYTLAVDRGNRAVAPLYDHLHPAVLRLIGMTVQAAHRQGRWVGLCGEMGSDLRALPLLIGLGLDEISVSSAALTAVRAAVGELTLAECQVKAAPFLPAR